MKGTFEPDGPLWEAFCHRGFRADDVALYEGNWIAQNKAARSCLAAHKSARSLRAATGVESRIF